MNNYFEIIDERGVIESPIGSFGEALVKLGELDNNDDFEQVGDLKIVEVYFIRV
jgi:hypothetical protein